VQNTETLSSTGQPIASAEESEKLKRKQSRQKFLDGIRASLGSRSHQLAFTVAQASVACGHSPTWGYRKVYSGEWRVTNRNGRLLVPRAEIEHFLSGAATYNPEGGEGNGRSSQK
jgi:uncharacterized cupin superfamily protein